MARNVEIKAKIDSADFETVRRQAAAMATEGPILLQQTDTFFNCDHGRLKLREFADGKAELIFYERVDASGPKLSSYVRSPCDPLTMKEILTQSNKVAGVVTKFREVFLVDQTRIHLDQLTGLGTFLELEVVLDQADSIEHGNLIANQIMAQLGVAQQQLISGSYFDLLRQSNQLECNPRAAHLSR